MALIVKRGGSREEFDERKVYGSVYAACASAHLDERACERTAGSITRKIKIWLKGKKQVDSAKIRNKVGAELKKKSKELHFFYEWHLPNLKEL